MIGMRSLDMEAEAPVLIKEAGSRPPPASNLVHAISVNTFIIVRILEPFWLCAGLIVALPTSQGRIAGKAIERAAA